MTTTRKTIARVGASVAITALALVGITGTQLAAIAAPGDIAPWNPAPEDVLIQDLGLPGAEVVPPGDDFLACLDSSDPSVTTYAPPLPTSIGYVTRIERSYPTVRSFIADGSQIDIPIMTTPCADDWGLTGTYFINDASVTSSSLGTSAVTEQIIGSDEALELNGDNLVIPNAHQFSDGSFGNSFVAQVFLERTDGTFLQGQIYHVVQINELTAASPALTAQQYDTITVTSADLLALCALGGDTSICEADGSYFTSVPVGATTSTDLDGNEVMTWSPFEAGEFTFEFVISDSVEGVFSASQTGTITVEALPDFIALAEAPSKNFSIVAGESITITHDLLGDVYATAFEGSTPVLLDPWEGEAGNRYPGWIVLYSSIPEGGTLVQQPLPEVLSDEPVSDLVFTSEVPGVYEFTYVIVTLGKNWGGFTTQSITSTITVTADEPELPKVTG